MEEDKKADEEGDPSDDVPSEAATRSHGNHSHSDEDDMSHDDIPAKEVAAERLERRKRSLEHASDDSDGDETPVEEQYEFKAITSRKMESGKPWYKCYWKFQKGYQYLPEARLRNARDLEAVCDEYMEALKDEPRL
ncbi:Hypothetical protein PHPALM_11490 [Phytophthora palmivora]|uniref:Chromo domain-containing protein n=1 Tax=Phytophthora palmivora TaxID=4796 RepID=A0A2P4Y238_9STRA|nr:Hypothetical protein PHPALM_11490 [Phytophthora palmivora]